MGVQVRYQFHLQRPAICTGSRDFMMGHEKYAIGSVDRSSSVSGPDYPPGCTRLIIVHGNDVRSEGLRLNDGESCPSYEDSVDSDLSEEAHLNFGRRSPSHQHAKGGFNILPLVDASHYMPWPSTPRGATTAISQCLSLINLNYRKLTRRYSK